MIIPDGVIAERIRTGNGWRECMELLSGLFNDAGIKRSDPIDYMRGYCKLRDFCLQYPEDIERLNARIEAMGKTCTIKSITETGEYSRRKPGAKLYDIVLIRPESPAYQLIWAVPLEGATNAE